MEQVNGSDPAGVTQEAKMMYMERVYKMTHAELFHELMRVHGESAKMIADLQARIEELESSES